MSKSFARTVSQRVPVSRAGQLEASVSHVWDINAARYEVIPVTTKEQAQTAYRLRAEVFCHEKGYEPPVEFECDSYDAHASQLLLWDHQKSRAIGCVRLVHGRYDGYVNTLPLEKICGDRLDTVGFEKIQRSGENYVEISRLLILEESRGDQSHPSATGQKSISPLLALLLGIEAYAEAKNIKHQIAIVERPLQVGMKRMGIPVQYFGESVEHKGTRYPIVMQTDAIRDGLRDNQKSAYTLAKRRMTRRLHWADLVQDKVSPVWPTTAVLAPIQIAHANGMLMH